MIGKYYWIKYYRWRISYENEGKRREEEAAETKIPNIETLKHSIYIQLNDQQHDQTTRASAKDDQ